MDRDTRDLWPRHVPWQSHVEALIPGHGQVEKCGRGVMTEDRLAGQREAGCSRADDQRVGYARHDVEPGKEPAEPLATKDLLRQTEPACVREAEGSAGQLGGNG